MKKVVLVSFVCMLVSVMLSVGGVRGDDSTDLAKLQPLSKEEREFYETVKNDAMALHKFIVARTYFRKIDQLCPPSVKNCCDIAPPLSDDIDGKYAVTFDEQILYLQLVVCRELSKGKK
jgi:hypothetical protein